MSRSQQQQRKVSPDQTVQDLRGKQAEALLADPLLTEVLDSLEKQYVKEWLATEPLDTAGRERLHLAVQVSRQFRVHLRVMIDSGKLARSQSHSMRTGTQ